MATTAAAPSLDPLGLQSHAGQLAQSPGPWRLYLHNRGAMLSLSTIVVLCFMAVCAPLLASYSPLSQDSTALLQPPDAAHLLGTDALGRDLLARLLYGARISLFVGFAAVVLGLLAGASLGVASGYAGGWIDDALMRCVDVLMAIPGVILAITILAAVGPSLGGVILAISIGTLPTYARLARSQTLHVRQLDYVLAAGAMGAGHVRIMSRHILPNIISVLIVSATASLGSAILTEAGLSFLGLGVPPPTPTWGGMVSSGREFIFTAAHVAIVPGLFIMLTVLAFNLAGDGLRDVLDPRSQAGRG